MISRKKKIACAPALVNSIIQGECLEVMKTIPDASIDMILCDLPYGTTSCKWDSIISLPALWEHYKRLIKPTGVLVLTSCQPFTTKLIGSNMDWFKYCWYWVKNNANGYTDAKNRPMRKVEEVCVFSPAPMTHKNKVGEARMTYNPQGVRVLGEQISIQRKNGRAAGANGIHAGKVFTAYTGYPNNVLYYDVVVQAKNAESHPTQKPVGLFDYLIRTYTNDEDNALILDNCAGSCTTAIACINTNRCYICIEQDPAYVAMGRQRVANATCTED